MTYAVEGTHVEEQEDDDSLYYDELDDGQCDPHYVPRDHDGHDGHDGHVRLFDRPLGYLEHVCDPYAFCDDLYYYPLRFYIF